MPALLCEALSRKLGRIITLDELGLSSDLPSTNHLLDWDLDTVVGLTDLGRVDVNAARRQVLLDVAYSVAALALPGSSWWTEQARRSRTPIDSRRVGRADVEAVRDTVALFQQMDQRRGGGHARSAVVQYLTSDVAPLLRGSFAQDQVRRDMFSAAGELAYLSGWMAFDNAEHSVAQHYFNASIKLSAEAGDAAMAGHVLRAMAHQAVDLGHFRQALNLAAASMTSERYGAATPRERALLGVVHARALAANQQGKQAAQALILAEEDLRSARTGDVDPQRVFFFGEASLAHETACTLRDVNDLQGAINHFRRSVRTRKAASFTRTHAVTLGYLGATQARKGEIEAACRTWAKALDAMEGVRSGRTRQVAATIRSTLAPFRRRQLRYVAEVDDHAANYLSASS
ncbi:Tat pathway signal protein [Actinoplanes sp. NPDC051346]|uniref:Tat pathway signal protein n=1 Tax=Actinoplanes sp. NPDC051346 TaxID=3155048 RepID=UPI003419516A